MKLRLLTMLTILLAFVGVSGAVGQEAASGPASAAVSLDLPHVSHTTVDGTLLAPAAEEWSLPRIPMPSAARKGAIGGAITGAVLGGAFGWFMTSTCDTGACSSVREGLVAGTAYGALAGAAVGDAAGRLRHAVRN